MSPSQTNELREQALQFELSEWLLRSEILWHQKYRELWLKFGDKNSKFFHLSIVIRRRSNSIDAIKAEDDSWIHNPKQICDLFCTNFSNLFREEIACFTDHLEHLILPCITKDENDILKQIPSPEEIKSTLFQMHDLKAPGPNEFPALFYKRL